MPSHLNSSTDDNEINELKSGKIRQSGKDKYKAINIYIIFICLIIAHSLSPVESTR